MRHEEEDSKVRGDQEARPRENTQQGGGGNEAVGKDRSRDRPEPQPPE